MRVNYRSSDCKQCAQRRKDGWKFCNICQKEFPNYSEKTSKEMNWGKVINLNVSPIPGYNSEGYNEGLGTVIRNKQQLKEVCKVNNFTAVG